MAKKERNKDLLDKFVVLDHDVKTNGGQVYPRGTTAQVRGTWRGKFTLLKLNASMEFIYHVTRSSFNVIRNYRAPCSKCSKPKLGISIPLMGSGGDAFAFCCAPTCYIGW